MKSEFNKNWNKSKQPRKQRKFIANAPIHIKHKLLSAHLNKSMNEKYRTRSIELRKNDEVKVMRGKFKGRNSKVTIVDSKNTRVQLDGINKPKKDGEKVPVWFHPSKLLITKLEDSDKKRFKNLKLNITQIKETKEKENAQEKN